MAFTKHHRLSPALNKMTKKNKKIKYKRAPMAPKRFKSAYMFYSAEQHRMIRDNAADKKIRSSDIAKIISRSWAQLTDAQKVKWQSMAKTDRERYDREKAEYNGPWKVANVKDPTAPKKPMSAFLAFGNERRRAIAEANPDLNGTEISCLLSKLWRECDNDVKQAYREREQHERQAFQLRRAEWERQKKENLGESSDADSETNGEAHDIDSCMDASSAQASSQINDVEDADEREWALFGRQARASSSHKGLLAPYPPSHPDTTCTIGLQTYHEEILNQSHVVPDKLDVPKTILALPVDHNRQMHQSRVEKSAKRFEDYSMDDVLQDDELFEDFLPSEVKDYPIIKQYFYNC